MNTKNRPRFGGFGVYAMLILLVIILWYTFTNNSTTSDFTQNNLWKAISEEKVVSIRVEQNREVPTGYLNIKLKDGSTERMYTSDVNEIQKELKEKDFTQFVVDDVPSESWIMTLLPYLLIFGAIFILFMIMSNNAAANNSGGKMMNFGKSNAHMSTDKDKKVLFRDVAGLKEEKEDLVEVVDFLKAPEKYTQVGARIPKGVLLVGPPGTGKTLLAKAVAGEAGVPFFSISGSDFVEMFVGVGASRVRDLFEEAKKNAPCIIFIDEIDAVGRHRGAGTGGGNDEREQTLNQLLVEMDGFDSNSGVIVMAATNRPDVLDPALLRPGRFDRQITVNRPDAQGREDILKVHAKNKPLAPDVNFKDLAQMTIGFTGADLENLLNEAALLAARKHKKALTNEEIQDAVTRVEMGTEKKSHKYSEKAKKLTAYHEAGHAVASYYLENHDPVKEISIIPRGMGAGGYTMYQPQEENYTSKNEMLDLLVSMLGGRVAEALTLDDVSTGASSDLQRATQICRDMVAKYGMSDEIGPVVFSDENNEVFLGKDFGHVNNYSEVTSARIDEEIEKMMRAAYAKTQNILKEHYDKLILVGDTLLAKEKIDGAQFEALMTNGKLPETEANSVDSQSDKAASETAGKHDEPLEKTENFVSAADTVSADDFVSKSDECNAHPVSDENNSDAE